jgi:hypothetical protein
MRDVGVLRMIKTLVYWLRVMATNGDGDGDIVMTYIS